MDSEYSQHIRNDAHRPHVSRERNRLEIDDLRCNKLRRPEKHLQLSRRIVLARQTEIDDLDAISRFSQTQNVFGLEGKTNASAHIA